MENIQELKKEIQMLKEEIKKLRKFEYYATINFCKHCQNTINVCPLCNIKLKIL